MLSLQPFLASMEAAEDVYDLTSIRHASLKILLPSLRAPSMAELS